MKILYILFILIFLISCKQKDKENTQNNIIELNNSIELVINDSTSEFKELTQNDKFIESNDYSEIIIENSFDELLDIFFDVPSLNLPIYYRDDMVQNITPIWGTSAKLMNLDEIEPNQLVNDILDKPFRNNNLSILAVNSKKSLLNGIEELFNIFTINLSQSIIDKFNISTPTKMIKIVINNINIYVYRERGTYFKLYLIEYNGDLYLEPELKMEYNKNDITNLLGIPSAYSDSKNIFMYVSFKTWRQIIIYFDNNDNIELIQLLSDEGP